MDNFLKCPFALPIQATSEGCLPLARGVVSKSLKENVCHLLVATLISSFKSPYYRMKQLQSNMLARVGMPLVTKHLCKNAITW